MQFVLLIYQGTTPLPNTPEWERLSADEQKAVLADYAALNKNPAVTAGLPLGFPKDARTVRVEGGETITLPGPLLGENGVVGGYLLLDAQDEAAAIAIAATVPPARHGGAVEVRPVGTYW